MSKTFRAWRLDEPLLFPPSVQDLVPPDHLSRFVVSLVRESLDLRRPRLSDHRDIAKS